MRLLGKDELAPSKMLQQAVGHIAELDASDAAMGL